MRLDKYFDKIYCINLDRRKDRWEETIKELDKWGLTDEVERYSAIDGKDIKGSYPISLGNVGLIDTNIKILEEAKEKKYKNILILEDDVEFTNGIKDLKDYYDNIPKDYDMIWFGGNHNLHMGKSLSRVNEKIIKLHSTYATHAVMINESMFDVIPTLISKKRKPIDVYYCDLQKSFNCYGFYPNIAIQRPSYSDIENKFMDNRWLFK
jgi:GR25 family glycosyltransferase involved in LPS biosynthesis